MVPSDGDSIRVPDDQSPAQPEHDADSNRTSGNRTSPRRAEKQNLRQAVVVIHGIGQQKPMKTLKEFITSVLPGKYHSTPDRMSGSLELRRLSSPSSQAENRPITDFYEFYWAHHMLSGRFESVVRWLLTLLRRWPWQAPRPLRPFYYATAVTILAVIGIFCWSLATGMWGRLSSGVSILGLSILEGPAMAIVLGVVQIAFGRFVLGYVADAARYLTPDPEHIEVRSKIRNEGLRLLRNLHERGVYNRIVIVGHSLGSVIGYDIIRHLWSERSHPEHAAGSKQSKMKEFDKSDVPDLKAAKEKRRRKAIEDFQQAQHGLWREYRNSSSPWLITDFVTLGSPLTYGDLLIADDEDDFGSRKGDREYPSCPPVTENGNTSYLRHFFSKDENGNAFTRDVRVLHHGAPFAVVRWTNLFFPYRRLVLGDIIGGEVGPMFGPGIRDVAVRPEPKSGWRSHLLSCHTRYWLTGIPEKDRAMRTKKDWETDTKECILALKSALKLGMWYSKDPWPPPGRLDSHHGRHCSH